MAAQELRRIEVKYIRDKAKSSYPSKEGATCRICGSVDGLEFHHYTGVTNLWNRFKKKQKINVRDVEDMETYRDQFIAIYNTELLTNGEMLCKEHHMALHRIYGKSPSLGTSKKQGRWVEKQRNKYGDNK